MTDAQLEIAYRNRASLSPEERAMVEEAHAELVRRRNASFAGTPAPVVSQPEPADFPDPVESAAAPITPDPVVAPAPSKRDAYAARLEAAGYTPKEAGMAADYEGTMKGAYELPESDEALRRGAAYMRDQDRRFDQFDSSMAEALGQGPSGSIDPAYEVTVDGVTVPSVIGADGKPVGDGQYYRLGDVKRAQAAAKEAQMGAEWDRQAKEDLANYGTRQLFEYKYTPDGRLARNPDGTPAVERISSQGVAGENNPLSAEEEAQQDRLAARKTAEARQYQQNRALAMEPGRQAEEARRMLRKDRVAQNAMLAGGSQNLNPMMRAQIGALRLSNDPRISPDVARSLRYVLPGGKLAAEVDARQAEQVIRLMQQQNMGRLSGGGDPLAQAQADAVRQQNALNQVTQREAVESKLAEEYAATGTFGYNDFTLGEQQAMYDQLMNVYGYDEQEARATVSRIAMQRRANQKLFDAEPR